MRGGRAQISKRGTGVHSYIAGWSTNGEGPSHRHWSMQRAQITADSSLRPVTWNRMKSLYIPFIASQVQSDP